MEEVSPRPVKRFVEVDFGGVTARKCFMIKVRIRGCHFLRLLTIGASCLLGWW